MLGIYLQGSCIYLSFFSFIISIIWFYLKFLVLLPQSQDIARTTALYMKFLIPGLFAYSILQNMLRFLQKKICSNASGYPFSYPNIDSCGPVTTSISLWISLILVGFYVLYAKKFKNIWRGISMESFQYLFTNLKLAFAMVCLEYWAFEFLVGLMPDCYM
ncbi:hypothetical protein MtrunA17_Chr4g0025551 [Medicago truncatula]|uniref:Transmembrane protein n=1 Tax=Medicago truncatula TaxID=3880 RepID=A0A396I455_MEDTR|nr:hypothetical protein MtrunA17_Chr4g0025551 [Medicago truncatula]